MKKMTNLALTMLFLVMIVSPLLAQIPLDAKIANNITQEQDSVKTWIETFFKDSIYHYVYYQYVMTDNVMKEKISNTDTLWGNYLLLDGVDDYAQAVDHNELDTGDEASEHLTVEAWVNFDPNSFSSEYIVQKYNSYELYTLEVYENNIWFRGFGIIIRSGGIIFNMNYKTNSGDFWNIGWHHLAAVVNKTNNSLSLYMDGKRKGLPWTRSWTVDNSNAVLKVGNFLKGKVDEIRISDNVRYEGTTYTLTTSPFISDEHTRALWHFDEYSGSTQIHDACGEDNLLICKNGAHTDGPIIKSLIADFVADKTYGTRPLTVQFTDKSSGVISNWDWNFGDGKSSTEQNPSHTYESADTFTVSLTVTGPGGSDTNTKKDFIIVVEAAPVADFIADIIYGTRPLKVQFTDKSSGVISNWDWNFGDGKSSTEQNPSHTYESADTFTVSLTVTVPGGSDTKTKTNYIIVRTLVTSLTGDIPLEYELYSNYPNPFNIYTNICFALPTNAEVRIHIFDINGKIVETILNSKMQTGYHTVAWNASNLPSGIYFIKFQSRDFVKVKKCILLK